MSFLGIRRWNLKGKAKSVSKKTSWVFPTANQLPSPPSTTTSAESFESPLIVEIAPSPSTIPEGPFVSPHIDVRLSHEPFFPANLFASETSVATSAGHGPESHEWNPYAPTPGKKAEGEKVVAIVSGDADNDEPEAWVDEPTARPNPNTVHRIPSRKNRPAPSPIQIPGTTTPSRPQSTASRRSTRASRGLRSATPYHNHPPVSSPVRGGDDDASVISGITLPGALIGGAFRVAHESEHDREREAPMPARPAGSRRITRVDSATLPRGIDPSLYSPHGASERADSPVDPGVATRASVSAGTGSRASVGAHVPPPLAILDAERSSLRPLRLPSGALELPSHRVSRISEARSSPPSSADLQSISPRRSSDSARSGQRPTSRAISNSILHPDKFVTKPLSRPPTRKESKEPSPSGTDDAFASAFPSASVPIAPSESLPSAAIPVSAAPLESASVPPESASVSIPMTLPTMPETPFSPDPLLDGVLPPFLPDGGDASSAPPSSSFPETSIASAFPETPFSSDRDFSRVSSGPPSRASSMSRAHRRRTATAGAATVASPKPRPVSQKQDAAALRQSIYRRRRSRARSQGRVVLSIGEELVAPSVPVMPASAVSIVFQAEAAQKIGRVPSMLVGPRERVDSKAKHEQTAEPVAATAAEKVDVKPLEGRKDGGKDRRREREREGGEGRGRKPRFIAGVPPAPLVEPPPPPRLDARSRSCGPSREPSSARSSEVDKDAQMIEVGVRTANIKIGSPPSQTVQVPGDRTRGAPTPAIGSPPKKSPLMTPKSANSSVGVSTLKGSPRVAAVSGAAQANGRPSIEDVTLRPSLGEGPRQPADIPPLSPPPSYERMDRPHTSADVAPITTATTFSSPLIPQRPGTSTASSVPMLPSRSVGADSIETVTPPRSGTPEQQHLHGSQVRRSTQVRLQGPMGPRQRTRNTSVSASPHIGPVSSVSITPPAPISEPVVPQPTTPEAAPAITSWPTPRFQEKPVGIRPYTLEAAQWTFSNTEFQGVVSRAIRQSAAPTSIRVLAPKILEEDLPREQERLNALIADLKMNYKLRVRKRNNLLASAGSMADGALRAKLDELRTLNEEMDEITERLYIARDQTAQLQLLVATHDGSALAIALRKLNASFLKRTQEAQELSERCEQLEAERDEAHAHAMRAAADLDQLNEALGNGTGTGDSSIASSSRRASVSRLSGQRGLRGFRSASRSQRASLASSAAGNRLSRQSIITSRSSVYSPFSPEEPLPPVPKIPPKLSTPALLAAGQSSNTGSAIDSYGSSVPPSSSITGNESARALRDVMNMLGIDHRAIKRRRVSMSSVGSPGLPPLSARSAAGFSSPLPILPVSPRPLMHGRSKSASTVDLLQAIRMEEVEREAVLAVLEKGLMNA